jgi:hypothetical protein
VLMQACVRRSPCIVAIRLWAAAQPWALLKRLTC